MGAQLTDGVRQCTTCCNQMEDEQLTSIVVLEGEMAGRRLTDRSLRLSLGNSSARSGALSK